MGNINYSIHTMELKKKIPLQWVSIYQQKLRKQKYRNYTRYGVRIDVYAAMNCGILKLKISLNSVYWMDIERVELFHTSPENIERLHLNLQEILKDADLGSVQTFQFSRVDFSVNARVENPQLYIALAYKSGIPYGFQPMYLRFDNPKRQKKIFYQRSYDVMQNKGHWGMTLYDKEQQLREDIYATEDDCMYAKGILRLEMKCDAETLRKMLDLQQHQIVYTKETLAYLLQNARFMLGYAVQMFFPKGTYYTLPDAYRMIQQAGGKSIQAERFYDWLRKSSDLQSAYKAKQQICENLSGSQKAALLRFQQQLHINPVTLGRRQKCRMQPDFYTVFGV